jgi:hypothetical protein
MLTGTAPNTRRLCLPAVRGDLVKVLKELLERKIAFDGIIIETTGRAAKCVLWSAAPMPSAWHVWCGCSTAANGKSCGVLNYCNEHGNAGAFAFMASLP